MIEKSTILLTSLGRTGTEYFARLFSQILPDSTSLHEPDIFQNTGVDGKFKHYLGQVRRAGIWRMVVLKALGKWTLVKLSDSKFTGRLQPNLAIGELIRQRQAFIDRMPGSVYMEANIGYYGLLDITPAVFREHRALFIVRDGRSWVKSHMNWGEFYGKRGIRKRISHNWPSASDIPDDPCRERWKDFSRFEKLCWAWARLNEYALKSLSTNPQARVYRFEDIFSKASGYEPLRDLVSFATSLPGINPAQIGSLDGWLERKSHQSTERFPGWSDWTDVQKNHFRETCNPLMEKLGYELS